MNGEAQEMSEIESGWQKRNSNSQIRDSLYEGMNRIQINNLEFETLLNELKGTGLYHHAIKMDNKLVLIMNSIDKELFQAIMKYKSDNPSLGRGSCLQRFAEFPNSDALVKIAFGSKLDSVLRYSATEPEPNYWVLIINRIANIWPLHHSIL